MKMKYPLVKILLALLPTIVLTQNYSWMTANKSMGIAFIVLWILMIWNVWAFNEKNYIYERLFRMTEIGAFLLPLSALIMMFVIGSQTIDTAGDEFSQAGAAVGTAIGGAMAIGIGFVVGLPVGIIMHLTANNYGKKSEKSNEKQPETFAIKHGVIASIGLLFLLAIVLGSIQSTTETVDLNTSETAETTE